MRISELYRGVCGRAACLSGVCLCLLAWLSLHSGCAATGQPTLPANPKTAKDYCQRGAYFLRKSQPLDAISEYTEAITLDQKYTDAYVMRSLCRTSVDDYEGAVTDLTQAIELRPEGAMYYQCRAMAYTYLDLGDTDKAIADYDKAIALSRETHWLYLSKASLLFQEARFAEAIPVYRACLANPPSAAGDVVTTFIISGLVGVLLDPLTNGSARAITQERGEVKEMIKLCESMLQQDGVLAASRSISPGMTRQEVLQIVMTTDRIVAWNSHGKSDDSLLVTVSRVGPIEDRILRVLVLNKGRLALEKRVPLREVMEIPGVSRFMDIPMNPTPPRSAVSELIGKTDRLLYEDDRQMVTVTEWATRKGKRVRFLNFDKGKLTSWTRGSRRLW